MMVHDPYVFRAIVGPNETDTLARTISASARLEKAQSNV
jgi:hypothetical protein